MGERHVQVAFALDETFDEGVIALEDRPLGELRAQFPDFCTRAVINRTADLNEATKRRTTVWDVNPKGTAANDLNQLTEELLYGVGV